jgi:hypothetical protein
MTDYGSLPAASSCGRGRRLCCGGDAAGEGLTRALLLAPFILTLVTTLFDDRYELDLNGTEGHVIDLGPCHQVGDAIVHVPKEGVVFAGDVLFRQCTPMGWTLSPGRLKSRSFPLGIDYGIPQVGGLHHRSDRAAAGATDQNATPI